MKRAVEDLVQKALELDEDDRAEVAARLLSSIETEEDAEVRRPRRAPTPPPQTKRFETKVFDLGPCQLEDLDDIARALAITEGEAFR